MIEDTKDINFSDLPERDKLLKEEIKSLDKKWKDKQNLININERNETPLTSFDPNFTFNSELVNIFKAQQMEKARLEQREIKAIKDINRLDKAIEALRKKLEELDEGKSTDIEDLNITNKMLSKAVKKYSTNFKMNISRTEQPSPDTFVAQVTFFFKEDSKTLDFTINRKERKIIDVNTSMFEELEYVKDKLITNEGLNIPLLIKTLK
ncbi:uncharacterized protein LOC143194099 [Rhynchophorus ferrugineus]|uniref:Kinetochore protein SPC25 n=1 Tax=Rhynchophorus ferrugineus TaxID=354439 RepID=A0A834IH82_RHYFE|nr:hypothetical protein GWI33_007796 [Rhynchophorus ferrugineus]